MASVSTNVNAVSDPQTLKALSATLSAAQADLAALRAAVVGITAQLDADGGVTDTDYAANNDPAALTLTT